MVFDGEGRERDLYPLVDLARAEAKSSFLSYDPEALRQVTRCLRSLIPLARTGSHLIALGRAIDAVETFETGRRASVNVDIGCGFRAGDIDFEEGTFAFIKIREENIELSTLNTTYEKAVGSDHRSDDFAFPEGFAYWCEIFNRVRNEEEAELSIVLHEL